jgi:hypothetical protein
LAITFYGLSLLWHATGGKYVSYTETYEVLFTVLAVYRFLVAKKSADMFICGLLAGIAFSFRLTGAFGALTILIFCLLQNRKYALVFCVGVLVSVASLLLCVLIAGISMYDMISYGLMDNFSSGSATDHTIFWKWHNFSAKFLQSGMLLFYPMVLGYLFLKRKFDLLVLWLVLAFTGICLTGIFDNVHLKEVLPPLAITSAFFVNYLISRYKFSTILILLAILVIFFPNISEQLANFDNVIAGSKATEQHFCASPYAIPDEGARKELGWWIRDNTSPGDKAYIAGFGAQVQTYSERVSPTVYFNATQTQLAKAKLFSDLRSNHPQIILVPLFPEYKQTVSGDMRDFVDSLVAKNYMVTGCMYNYEVFKLKN